MSRVPLLLAAAVTAVVVAVGVLAVGPSTVAQVRGRSRPSLEATATGAPAAPSRIRPVGLLRAWDARRAAAWARGDPRLLASLYTPRSAAGRHDVAMLRRWVARGLVVQELRTQLLAVETLRASGRAWTLRVTDRLVGGVAVGADLRRPLPRDQATTSTVRLCRRHGVWLVAAVREDGPQDA